MDLLKQSIEKMTSDFNNRMAEFQKDLHNTASSHPASVSPTSRLASEFDAFRTLVLSSLESLQCQVQVLTKLYEHQELRSRRKILLIHGVPETQKENVTTKIVDVLSKKLDVPGLDADAFSRCHRLGKAISDKPRPIVAKFRNMTLRDNIWFSKSGLKGSGVTISEFLTSSRHETFQAARSKFGVAKCWTRNGYVFVLALDGKRHRVESLSELNAISSASESVSTNTNIQSNKDTKLTSRTKRIPKAK
ncbi:uncharacterized protein LOC123702913 [Colias croceus]|uniref:uncharacterized protein LOC123702913 n=1 Tax=Colias crocea TaxID=72248 RepID=UPI001E27FF7A|nr:uncharacterized protein LOC123702913 [Colias croceus]